MPEIEPKILCTSSLALTDTQAYLESSKTFKMVYEGAP